MNGLLLVEAWRNRRLLIGAAALLLLIPLGLAALVAAAVSVVPLAPPEVQAEYQKVADSLPVAVPYQNLIAVDAVRLGQNWSRVTADSIGETADLFYTCPGGSCRRRPLDEVLEDLKFSAAQQAAVRQMIAAMTGGGGDGFAPNLWGPLVWPVDGPLTAYFGRRDSPTEPGSEEMHWGVDIAAETGTPIKAATAGRITFTGVAGGYGNLLLLWNPDTKLVAWYGHLSGYAVKKGEEVQAGQGQVIGYVGSTGRSTGPHLHFEIRPQGGTPVDPLDYYR